MSTAGRGPDRRARPIRRSTRPGARATPDGGGEGAESAPRANGASAFLPIAAIVAFVAIPGIVLISAEAAGTLGYDFLAYHQAAQRVLHGQALYDPTVVSTGGFGFFYYPPPFVLAILPLGLLGGSNAVLFWAGLSVAMLALAIALMPVRPAVRWSTLLLAGLSWPVAYALKLGQVGPLLFLLFAIGWRSLERPGPLGLVGAIGAAVKIQPGIVLAWALLTRRWRAAAIGVTALAVAAIVATAVAGGPSIWPDYLTLLRNVSDPITTPHNFTPGSVAFQLGAGQGAAVAIQVASSVAVIVIFVVAALRLPGETSYLVAVVASQLLSPVLWDHYAMLLLLPVAFLLERRAWWSVAIPLATSVLVLPFGLPAILYPAAFWTTIAALLVVGRRPTTVSAAARA